MSKPAADLRGFCSLVNPRFKDLIPVFVKKTLIQRGKGWRWSPVTRGGGVWGVRGGGSSQQAGRI